MMKRHADTNAKIKADRIQIENSFSLFTSGVGTYIYFKMPSAGLVIDALRINTHIYNIKH